MIVTTAFTMDALRTLRVPMCLLVPGAGQSDPLWGEEPDYLVIPITARIVTQHQGDAVGEVPLLGGHLADSTKSEGQGLYDIAVEVHDAIGKLTTADSIDILHRRMGESGAIPLEEKPYWYYQDVLFEAIVTAT